MEKIYYCYRLFAPDTNTLWGPIHFIYGSYAEALTMAELLLYGKCRGLQCIIWNGDTDEVVQILERI